MLIALRIAARVADHLHPGGNPSASGEAQHLLHLAEELGCRLRPVHPDHADEGLRRDFQARLPEGAEAQRLLAAWRAAPGVEGAYLKPPEEPAEGGGAAPGLPNA